MILSYHAMFIDELANLWSVGNNVHGQLGVSNEIRTFEDSPVKTLSNVKQVATGLTHTAVVTSDNRVMTVGDNTFSQLGHNDTYSVEDRYNYEYVDFNGTGEEGIVNIVHVECGVGHTIALDSDGNVWLWGDNSRGQCGYYNTYQMDEKGKVVPLPIKLDPSTFENYTDILPYDPSNESNRGIVIDGNIYEIAAGNYFSMLRINNIVWIWGSNDDAVATDQSGYYRTHIPQCINKYLPNGENLTDQSAKIVTAIAGDRFVSFLTEDNTVFMGGTFTARENGEFTKKSYKKYTTVADEIVLLHYSPSSILMTRNSKTGLFDEAMELKVSYDEEELNKRNLLVSEKKFIIDLDFHVFDFAPGIKYDIFVKGWKYLGTTNNTYVSDISNLLYNGTGRV